MARSINTNNCSGTEAVVIVTVDTWLKDEVYPKLAELAQNTMEKVGGFNHFHDVEIGRTLIETNELVDKFYAWVVEHPILVKLLEHPEVNIWRLRTWVDSYLSSDLGAKLKKLPWWEENLAELEKHKKSLKTVRKVMNS